jgi:hypothetical protein
MSLQTKQSGELITQAKRAKLMAIEQLRRDASTEIAQATADGSEVLRGIVVARAMQGLRELLSPDVMGDVMMLQNTPLGFLTDKPQGGYPVEVVRDCVIVALLSGFKVTGNEFNVITGKFYMTKEGARARLLSWPGISNVEIELGVPQVAGDKGALVEAVAKWRLDGRQHELACTKPTAALDRDTRIPVRVNAGMGVDAILGKAIRKLYARILERLTGMQLDQEDASTDGVIDATVTEKVAGEPSETISERGPTEAASELRERIDLSETTAELDATVAELDRQYSFLTPATQDELRKHAADKKAKMRVKQ